MINNSLTHVAFQKWNATFFKLAKLLSLILLNIFLACTKQIDVTFDNQSFMVVNSIFNPDSVFTFYFSTTTTPISEYDSFIEKFELKLFENEELLLDTNLRINKFRTDIYPRQNAAYRVQVIPENLPSVKAIDSIPDIIQIKDAKFIIPYGIDSYGDYYAGAEITFSDPPNEKNYYELLITYPQNNTNSYYWSPATSASTLDKVLLNEGDQDYDPTSFFFSDELIDGETYTIKVKQEGYGQTINYQDGFNSGFFATLRSISKSYYLYRKYYTRHAYNQQTQGEFLDLIFKGEPQNMYNNIENGYGIFAGYQETTRELIYNKPE